MNEGAAFVPLDIPPKIWLGGAAAGVNDFCSKLPKGVAGAGVVGLFPNCGAEA